MLVYIIYCIRNVNARYFARNMSSDDPLPTNVGNLLTTTAAPSGDDTVTLMMMTTGQHTAQAAPHKVYGIGI